MTEVKILGICYFAGKTDLAAIPNSGDPQDSHTAQLDIPEGCGYIIVSEITQEHPESRTALN